MQGTRNQFSIDYIQRTSGQEAVLLTKSRKTQETTQQPPAEFVLKRSLLEDTLRTIHEPHHPGRDVMLFKIKRLWYWKDIKKDVTNFLQQCVHCQKAKPTKQQPPIQPIKVSKPRERAQMDITYLPPDSVTGEKYLLVVIDMFTKFIWAKALEKRDAASVYTYLKDNFGDTGFEIWQSDNGGEFKNHQVKELIEEQFNSVQIHGASRKPSTQGGVKRVNQTLKSKIRPRLKDNGNWSSYLNEVLLNYNISFHSSIDMTPWYAEYGREYETPAIVSNNTNQKLFLLMEARLKESHQQEDKEQIVTRIQTNLEKNAERMRNQQKNVKITEFNIGKRVLIKSNKRKIKKGELLFPYEGVISKKTKHYRYKVVWKTQGPLKMDKPSTESKRWFTTRDLKKFQYLEKEEKPF